MRLFRWIAFALLGYFIRSFVQGLFDGKRAGRRQSAGRSPRRAPDEEPGRYGVLTGPGVGREITVEDPVTGSSIHERVGRGVISR